MSIKQINGKFYKEIDAEQYKADAENRLKEIADVLAFTAEQIRVQQEKADSLRKEESEINDALKELNKQKKQNEQNNGGN